jgi:hypothetical protein
MAKKPTQVKTIADKLSKVNENFSVNMYDNGFMFEISGQGLPNDDDETEWATVKIIVPTVEELVELIKEAAEMERD